MTAYIMEIFGYEFFLVISPPLARLGFFFAVFLKLDWHVISEIKMVLKNELLQEVLNA